MRVLLIILFLLPLSSWAASKKEVMAQLKDLRNRNRTQLELVERQIRQYLGQFRSKTQPTLQPGRLDSLVNQRDEYLSRQHFYNRIIFMVTTKHSTGTKLQDTFRKELPELIYSDIRAKNKAHKIWKFLQNLAIAMTQHLEPEEAVIPFLEAYIKYSSISNPKPVGGFFKERHYTNGRQSASARVEEASGPAYTN